MQEGTTAKWDGRYLDLAREIGSWSKDRSRKVGCVIVGPAGELRTTGYNGFPRGVNDDVPSRHVRPEKYLWTEHAERNAIYNAARVGTPLEGCSIYLPWFPCIDCARAIAQSGIVRVVAVKPDFFDPKYGQEFLTGVTLLHEAGVEVRYVAGAPPEQQ